MKRIVFWAVAWGCLAVSAPAQPLPVAPYLPAQTGPAAQNAPITVQYPHENMTVVRAARNVYLFGKLNLPNPTLQINSQEVPVYKNGTFIAYVPVESGHFALELAAQSGGQTYRAVRHIIVPGLSLKELADKTRLDEEELYPARPVWVLPGEVVALSARGTPEAEVTATLSSLHGGKNIKLTESKRTPGLYQAKFLVRESQRPRLAKVTYTLRDKNGTRVRATAPAKLKVLDPHDMPLTAKVKDPGTKLRQLPVHSGSLYPYYRAYGQVRIDGRDNGLYRLRLGGGETAWLEETKLAFVNGQDYPPNTLYSVQTLAEPARTQVRWQGTRQVPVSVHEFNNRLELTFYDTPQWEENISFDATSPLLERLEWQGPQDGVVKFILYFKEGQSLWGHGYAYEDASFVLTLRHRPEITPTAAKPLLGARIVLDAGHSPKRTPPYDGLVSPSGYLEYEANLALAEVLKPKLEAAGATVIMTREGNNQMSLAARHEKALETDGHIFISLHQNALPETADPLARPRGYSVYYTYPHSFALAESIYQAFTRRINLPDSGLIANDVLFIPRMPQLPSVLVENVYMILPEQEEFVMSEQGREQLANTLLEGILHFYGADLAPAASKSAKRR